MEFSVIKYLYVLIILQVLIKVNAKKLACEFDRHHDVCWIRDLHINSTTLVHYEPNSIRHPIKVMFTRSHIYKFPSKLFNFYPTITSVSMNFALLTDIGVNSFGFASQLKDLNLSHNILTKLGAACFRGARSLLTLDLSHNRISYLNSYALMHLENLSSLDLSFNEFVYFNVEALRTYNLVDSKLKYIYLNNNKINSINFTEIHLSSIETIHLSSNQLTSVVLQYNSLNHIVLVNNNLTSVDFYNSSARSLNCMQNKLTNIEFLRGMKELTYLDLSDNFITNFTPINRLKSLKELILRNSGFKVYDFSIFNGLNSMMKVDLSENNLSTLDLKFMTSEDIVKLEIDNNNFTEIFYKKINEKFSNLRAISFFRTNLKFNFNCTYLQEIVDFFVKNSVRVFSDHNFVEYKKYNLTSIQGILCLNGTTKDSIKLPRNEIVKDESVLEETIEPEEKVNEEFSSDDCVPVERKEYFKYSLLWTLIVIVISFLFYKLFVFYNKNEYFKFLVRFRTSPRTDVSLLCNEF